MLEDMFGQRSCVGGMAGSSTARFYAALFYAPPVVGTVIYAPDEYV
jgi:hypothetical protein